MWDPVWDPDGDDRFPLTRDRHDDLVREEWLELQAADDAERYEMEACARLEAETETE